MLVASAWLLGLIGASLGPAAHWHAAAALAALAVGLGASVWGLRSRSVTPTPRGSVWVLGAAALISGVAVGPGHASDPSLPPAGMARFDALVERVQHGGDGAASSLVRVLRGTRLEDGAPIAPDTRLWVAPHALPEGAHVRMVAKVRPTVPFRNPSPHPRTPAVLPAQGRAWLPSANAATVVEHAFPARILDAVRAHVRERLEATLPARAAGMARALILGDSDATPDDDLHAVRGSGLTHVLAVSGLHVSILAGILVALLHRTLLWLPLAARFEMRRVACAAGVPLALAVAALTGGAPSGWRAAFTAALGWALVAFGQRPAPGPVAACAVMLLGALHPHEAAEPGLLLSVVATAAILSIPRVPERDVGAWLRAALALSWRTTVATAPIVVWCFGAVPIIGILANVLLVPVGSLLLVLAAAHALAASTLPFAATLTGAPFAAVANAFVTGCATFARLGPGRPWPPLDVAQGVVVALAAAGILFAPGWRRCAAVAMLAALVVGGLEWRLRSVEAPHGNLRVTFLDVGQGDAALVDLPDGRLMLVDAGGNPGGGVDPGSAVIVPLLAARRRSRVDIAVLTHPHPDHYGGLAAVLDAVEVGEIWDTGQAVAEADIEPSSAVAAELLRKARARGIRVRGPRDLCGRATHAGSATIRVVAPCPTYDSGYGANDNSLVIRIDDGARSFLFTGDAEHHAEDALLARAAPLRSDVLKVGHHGSRTSTSASFLAAVAPRLAVISAGAANPFGHPHAEVVERLHAAVPRVLSLAVTGGTIVETDGHALDVKTWAGERWGM